VGPRLGYIAVRPAAWETPLLKKQVAEFLRRHRRPRSAPRRRGRALDHENQRVTRVLNGALVAALERRKTPQQALADAQADAERILLPYQR
jgi:sn-glycerol 3-phosphate transport system substrate-binding protein